MIRVLVLLSLLVSTQSFADTQEMACTAATGETAYKVAGMTCGDCENTVSKQLGKLPQVAKATANHQTGCLKVVWKPGKSLSDAQVASELKKVKFDLAKTPSTEETHSH